MIMASAWDIHEIAFLFLISFTTLIFPCRVGYYRLWDSYRFWSGLAYILIAWAVFQACLSFLQFVYPSCATELFSSLHSACALVVRIMSLTMWAHSTHNLSQTEPTECITVPITLAPTTQQPLFSRHNQSTFTLVYYLFDTVFEYQTSVKCYS